jgi:hypothetical protein
MGSGGLAVDAMAIGCLGVERRVERFFSYLAILSYGALSGHLMCKRVATENFETFHFK